MDLNERISATGRLELEDGVQLQCEFEILQYFDGSLAIECKSADPLGGLLLMASAERTDWRIVGQTAAGQLVAPGDDLQVLSIDGDSATLSTNAISISDAEPHANAHRFLLANLVFPGAAAGTMPAPVALEIPTEPPTQVALVPRSDYWERELLLKRHKQPTPTAFLQFDSAEPLSAVEELASEVCAALSIVQGHKVNWISHEVTDSDGTVRCQRLSNRVTKRSSGLALNWQGGNKRRLPLAAIPECFLKLRDLQAAYGSFGSVLEIWLEARTDADYLETRALKFVIVIEALCTAVLRHESRSSSIAPSRKQSGRRPFRLQIDAAFGKLGVDEPEQSVKLFIASRNNLVHEGAFRCNSDPDAVQQDRDAPQDQIAEYLFIAGFVDRVIMQAVGLGSHPAKS